MHDENPSRNDNRTCTLVWLTMIGLTLVTYFSPSGCSCPASWSVRRSIWPIH